MPPPLPESSSSVSFPEEYYVVLDISKDMGEGLSITVKEEMVELTVND